MCHFSLLGMGIRQEFIAPSGEVPIKKKEMMIDGAKLPSCCFYA
jgi:hypothetical protein